MTFTINYYTKKNCPLCDKGKLVLKELSTEFSLNIKEFDIYQDDQLLELYQVMIPVIEIDGEEIAFGIIEKELVRNHLLSQMREE